MTSVLVVEDSAAMRGLIASIIEQIEGCVVTEVEGGFQALKKLPQTRFDLIITDINMPDINGLELLSYIRKNPSTENTPVLIVTSEDSAVQKDRGMALGANAVITKPFEADELLRAVQGLL